MKNKDNEAPDDKTTPQTIEQPTEQRIILEQPMSHSLCRALPASRNRRSINHYSAINLFPPAPSLAKEPHDN